ncbi:acyltransferase [Mucilaginibacter sp.]|uniref:acyltransferase n=1 Tax=Mucilaginibacter sp. TaxID=1882438 RepID=UPI0026230E44|nr:acyltransferase [Mucilaginibacter sp.]MDB5126975.1 acetyltransferase [Mucilaginibacter sp.]
MIRVDIKNDQQCLVDVKLGDDVKIFNFVNAYGCSIDSGTKIGAFVEIQKGATIGKNCKISSHSFICEGVHIADNVFVGHNVTFINDKFPRAITENGALQTEDNWECIKTFIEEGASIGSSVTILCGVRVGKRSVIGAGSVVTRNVEENTIVAGNPARFIRTID